MTKKETLAQQALQDSLLRKALAEDMVDNAEHSKWKLSLYFSMASMITYALWAIYFQLRDGEK